MALRQVGQRRRQPLEVAIAGVQHGQPRDLRLDRHAHLDQLQRAGLLGDLVLLDRLAIGDEGAAADAGAPPAAGRSAAAAPRGWWRATRCSGSPDGAPAAAAGRPRSARRRWRRAARARSTPRCCWTAIARRSPCCCTIVPPPNPRADPSRNATNLHQFFRLALNWFCNSSTEARDRGGSRTGSSWLYRTASSIW